MAERSPIFSTKGDRPQIGYVEGNEAFDLFGRPRCQYSAVTGNLCDSNTGKIVGHVSLEGNFVGASWLADELFGQRDVGEAHANLRSVAGMPSPSSSEQGTAAAVPGREPMLSATDPIVSPISDDELLDRAIKMVRTVLDKRPV